MKYWKRLLSVVLVQTLLFAPVAYALPSNNEDTVPLSSALVEKTRSESRIIVSAPVTPEEGGVLEAGSVRLQVPPGAVDKTVMITISALFRVAALSDGRQNVTIGAKGYRFEPKGLKFSKEVLVTLPYDPSLNDDETVLDDLYTSFLDTDLGRWVRLPRQGINKEENTITSRTTHFTDMVNNTLALPEAPSPIDFDLNSIKSLEAVLANTEIPSLEGLEPSEQGSATFRIPFRLLPGRGGATPPLALSYNSGGGNGLMGLGFDIGTSSVRIDTRFGLPEYDKEDTYVLDGEELTYMGESGEARVYILRKEGRLARIRWFADEGDWWEISERNGTVRIYGDEGAWLGPGRTEGSVKSGKDQGVYIWRLRRIIDANGNSVDYDWEYDEEDRNLYLKAVAYSGRDGENAFGDGTVRVDFLYDQIGHCIGTEESGRLGIADTGENIRLRPDVRIESRGKFPIIDSRRLDALEIRTNNDGSVLNGAAYGVSDTTALVRSYRFLYKVDPFGRTVLRRYEEAGPSGELFYGYDFQYHEPASEEDGYMGFEEDTLWSYGGTEPDYSGLNYSVNTGSSMGLYTGLEIYIPILFWKKKILSIGLRGSGGGGSNAIYSDLTDLNGDGLPDLAWRSGDDMIGVLNSGSGTGFSGRTAYLYGLNGHYSSGGETEASFGLSAGIGPVSGGYTRQWGWSEGKRTPTDINGDGYLDFIEKGNPKFGLNDGKGNISWVLPQDTATGEGFSLNENFSPAEIEDLKRNYYCEEPLREWRAWRSGTVYISDKLEYEASAAGSNDGAEAKILLPDGSRPESLFIVCGAAADVRNKPVEVEVNRRDAVYFHLDAGDDVLNDPVLWNVDIRYGAIKLFEDMGDSAEIAPPLKMRETMVPSLGLDDLYEPDPSLTEKLSDYQEINYSGLMENWKEIINENHIRILVSEGYLEPRRLTANQYKSFSSYVRKLTFQEPDAEEKKNRAVINQALAWFYDPATGCYHRTASGGTDYLSEWIRSEVHANERSAMASYSLPHRENPVLLARIDDNPAESVETGPEVFIEARRPSSREDLNLGECGPNGEILLEKINPEDGRGLISFFLVEENGVMSVEERRNGAVRELPLTDIREDTESLRIEAERDGILHRFILDEPDSLLLSMSKEVYETLLRPVILADEEIVPTGIDELAADEFAALQSAAETLSRTLPADAYFLSGGRYLLNPALSAEKHHLLLQLWDAVPTADTNSGKGSLFSCLTGGDFPFRAVPWTSSQADDFNAAINGGFDLLVEWECGDETRYVPSDSDDPEWISALKRYRADVELFPYYVFNEIDDLYRLNGGYDEETVRDFITEAGLSVYSRLERSLIYRADALLEVREGFLPSGMKELESTQKAGEVRTPPGTSSPTGFTDYPYFDTDGVTKMYRAYVHRFDTEKDFSPLDISTPPIEIEGEFSGEVTDDQVNRLKAMPREYLSGGVAGWFYGQWNGYHGEFDPSFFSGEPDYSSYNDIQNKSDAAVEALGTPIPSYYIPLKPNRLKSIVGPDEYYLSQWGGDLTVSEDSWIGDISENAYTDLDSQGRSIHKMRRYTALIEGDLMRPSRRGGERYEIIPGVSSTSVLDTIGAGRTITNDINGGVDFGLGIKGSHNWGKSYQYAGLIDINGEQISRFA